jgi:energy-coupling factor transporter ATP-binding protein EcfA2
LSGLEHSFEQALSSVLYEVSDTETPSLCFADFNLSECHEIASQTCEQVSQQNGVFLTEEQYLGLWQKNINLPIPPDKESPQFDPSGIKYSNALERRVARMVRYQKALSQHEQETQTRTRLRTQILTIRDYFSQSRMGYLDYVRATLGILSGQANKIALPSRAVSVLKGMAEDKAHDKTLPNISPSFANSFFFTPKPFQLSERLRKQHTFICGGTGSGKSQTILNIVQHYLTKDTKPALIVFDPHGPLATAIAKSKEFIKNDRLVYIDLAPNAKVRAAFNPFDLADNQKSTELMNPLQKHLAAALGQLFEQGVSPQMKALLVPCVGVMLHRDGSTLMDLYKIMGQGADGDLVKYGREKLPNALDRQFFAQDFVDKKSYGETKAALKRRLFDLVRDPIIQQFLCQPSTIDLPAAIEAGKVIVVNFRQGKTDEDVIRTIGQLLTGYISGYAIRRHAQNMRSPRTIHLFQDECHYFVSPKIREILTETRKFKLHATLATQTLKQVGANDSAVVDLIVANCGVFHVGSVGGDTATKLGKLMGVKAEDVTKLPSLSFYIWQRGRIAVRTKIPYIGTKYSIKADAWNTARKEQYQRYYKANGTSANPRYSREHKPPSFEMKLPPLDPIKEARLATKPFDPKT